MKLIPLNILKAYLSVDDNKNDSLMVIFIEGVSARIETALNRKLKREARTFPCSEDRKHYALPAYPILKSTVIVTINGEVKTVDSDYYVYEDTGVVFLNFTPETYLPIPSMIIYTGGYEEVNGVLSVPDDLKRACLLQSAADYKRRNDIGLKSVSMGTNNQVVIENSTGLLKEVQDIIDTHRRIPFGY